MFSFQSLDVYRCSIEFIALADRIAAALPRGQAAMGDQLRRASLSIPLNIAESDGRTGLADARRHLAIARGSTMECAAILDAARAIGLVEPEAYRGGIGRLS